MLVIALVGYTDTSVQCVQAHMLIALKGVVPLIGILNRRGAIARGLVQSLEAFLGDLLAAVFGILLELAPQSLVGRSDLPFHTTGQLRRKMIACS